MMNATEIAMHTLGRPRVSERRRNPRYPFVANVEIVDLESGMTTMTVHTSDISRGGCYVDTFNPLPQDTVVKLRLTKSQQTLETRAKVVYSSASMGMGLMFGRLDTVQREIVESWLTQVCGAQTY